MNVNVASWDRVGGRTAVVHLGELPEPPSTEYEGRAEKLSSIVLCLAFHFMTWSIMWEIEMRL